jgi:glycine/D-amino acid oxidase-like deaminating enzyme
VDEVQGNEGENMPGAFYDVIMVGGGIMGSATAYYLMKMDPKINVAVVERDPTYERASTTLSMANIRIQFSLKQNVQVSQYAFEVLDRFEEEMAVGEDKPNIAFHREGNLFLVDEKGRAVAKKALDMQKSLGCPVDWWSPGEIKEHYPLYDATPYVGGTFGPKDGHLDAYAVLMGYKAKARSLGTEYIKDEVTQVLVKGKEVSGVRHPVQIFLPKWLSIAPGLGPARWREARVSRSLCSR